MPRRRRIAPSALAASAALAFPTAVGAAGLSLVSQTREVRIDIEHTEDVYASCIPLIDPLCTPDSSTTTSFPDEETAPDAGPWTATAALPAFPATSASQSSEIGASSLHASGSHAGVASYSSSGGFPITFVSEDHTSETHFFVEFDLSVDQPFELGGSVTTEGGALGSSTAFVRLSSASLGVIAEVQVDSDPGCLDPSCATVGPEPIADSGVLAAGRYMLEAFAGGTATGLHSTSGSSGGGDAGAFEVDLALAPPAVPALPPSGGLLLGVLLVLAGRRGTKPPLRLTSW